MNSSYDSNGSDNLIIDDIERDNDNIKIDSDLNESSGDESDANSVSLGSDNDDPFFTLNEFVVVDECGGNDNAEEEDSASQGDLQKSDTPTPNSLTPSSSEFCILDDLKISDSIESSTHVQAKQENVQCSASPNLPTVAVDTKHDNGGHNRLDDSEFTDSQKNQGDVYLEESYKKSLKQPLCDNLFEALTKNTQIASDSVIPTTSAKRKLTADDSAPTRPKDAMRRKSSDSNRTNVFEMFQKFPVSDADELKQCQNLIGKISTSSLRGTSSGSRSQSPFSTFSSRSTSPKNVFDIFKEIPGGIGSPVIKTEPTDVEDLPFDASNLGINSQSEDHVTQVGKSHVHSAKETPGKNLFEIFRNLQTTPDNESSDSEGTPVIELNFDESGDYETEFVLVTSPKSSFLDKSTCDNPRDDDDEVEQLNLTGKPADVCVLDEKILCSTPVTGCLNNISASYSDVEENDEGNSVDSDVSKYYSADSQKHNDTSQTEIVTNNTSIESQYSDISDDNNDTGKDLKGDNSRLSTSQAEYSDISDTEVTDDRREVSSHQLIPSNSGLLQNTETAFAHKEGMTTTSHDQKNGQLDDKTLIADSKPFVTDCVSNEVLKGDIIRDISDGALSLIDIPAVANRAEVNSVVKQKPSVKLPLIRSQQCCEDTDPNSRCEDDMQKGVSETDLSEKETTEVAGSKEVEHNLDDANIGNLCEAAERKWVKLKMAETTFPTATSEKMLPQDTHQKSKSQVLDEQLSGVTELRERQTVVPSENLSSIQKQKLKNQHALIPGGSVLENILIVAAAENLTSKNKEKTSAKCHELLSGFSELEKKPPIVPAESVSSGNMREQTQSSNKHIEETIQAVVPFGNLPYQDMKEQNQTSIQHCEQLLEVTELAKRQTTAPDEDTKEEKKYSEFSESDKYKPYNLSSKVHKEEPEESKKLKPKDVLPKVSDEKIQSQRELHIREKDEAGEDMVTIDNNNELALDMSCETCDTSFNEDTGADSNVVVSTNSDKTVTPGTAENDAKEMPEVTEGSVAEKSLQHSKSTQRQKAHKEEKSEEKINVTISYKNDVCFCETCGMRWETSESRFQFFQHLIFHSIYKPYFCNVCKATFVSLSEVNRHNKRIHTGCKSVQYGIKYSKKCQELMDKTRKCGKMTFCGYKISDANKKKDKVGSHARIVSVSVNGKQAPKPWESSVSGDHLQKSCGDSLPSVECVQSSAKSSEKVVEKSELDSFEDESTYLNGASLSTGARPIDTNLEATKATNIPEEKSNFVKPITETEHSKGVAGITSVDKPSTSIPKSFPEHMNPLLKVCSSESQLAKSKIAAPTTESTDITKVDVKISKQMCKDDVPTDQSNITTTTPEETSGPQVETSAFLKEKSTMNMSDTESSNDTQQAVSHHSPAYTSNVQEIKTAELSHQKRTVAETKTRSAMEIAELSNQNAKVDETRTASSVETANSSSQKAKIDETRNASSVETANSSSQKAKIDETRNATSVETANSSSQKAKIDETPTAPSVETANSSSQKAKIDETRNASSVETANSSNQKTKIDETRTGMSAVHQYVSILKGSQHTASSSLEETRQHVVRLKIPTQYVTKKVAAQQVTDKKDNVRHDVIVLESDPSTVTGVSTPLCLPHTTTSVSADYTGSSVEQSTDVQDLNSTTLSSDRNQSKEPLASACEEVTGCQIVKTAPEVTTLTTISNATSTHTTAIPDVQSTSAPLRTGWSTQYSKMLSNAVQQLDKKDIKSIGEVNQMIANKLADSVFSLHPQDICKSSVSKKTPSANQVMVTDSLLDSKEAASSSHLAASTCVIPDIEIVDLTPFNTQPLDRSTRLNEPSAQSQSVFSLLPTQRNIPAPIPPRRKSTEATSPRKSTIRNILPAPTETSNIPAGQQNMPLPLGLFIPPIPDRSSPASGILMSCVPVNVNSVTVNVTSAPLSPVTYRPTGTVMGQVLKPIASCLSPVNVTKCSSSPVPNQLPQTGKVFGQVVTPHVQCSPVGKVPIPRMTPHATAVTTGSLMVPIAAVTVRPAVAAASAVQKAAAAQQAAAVNINSLNLKFKPKKNVFICCNKNVQVHELRLHLWFHFHVKTQSCYLLNTDKNHGPNSCAVVEAIYNQLLENIKPQQRCQATASTHHVPLPAYPSSQAVSMQAVSTPGNQSLQMGLNTPNIESSLLGLSTPNGLSSQLSLSTPSGLMSQMDLSTPSELSSQMGLSTPSELSSQMGLRIESVYSISPESEKADSVQSEVATNSMVAVKNNDTGIVITIPEPNVIDITGDETSDEAASDMTDNRESRTDEVNQGSTVEKGEISPDICIIDDEGQLIFVKNEEMANTDQMRSSSKTHSEIASGHHGDVNVQASGASLDEIGSCTGVVPEERTGLKTTEKQESCCMNSEDIDVVRVIDSNNANQSIKPQDERRELVDRKGFDDHSNKDSTKDAVNKESESQPNANTDVEGSDTGFYKCGTDGCSFQSLDNSSFKVHMNDQHPNTTNWVCAYCGCGCHGSDSLIRHMTHHWKKSFILFPCSVTKCKFHTNRIQEIREHCELTHPNVNSFLCSVCRKELDSLASYLEHLQSSVLKFVQCPYCGARDANRQTIKQHITEKHPGKAKQISVSSQRVCSDRSNYGYIAAENSQSRQQPELSASKAPLDSSALRSDSSASVIQSQSSQKPIESPASVISSSSTPKQESSTSKPPSEPSMSKLCLQSIPQTSQSSTLILPTEPSTSKPESLISKPLQQLESGSDLQCSGLASGDLSLEDNIPGVDASGTDIQNKIPSYVIKNRAVINLPTCTIAVISPNLLSVTCKKCATVSPCYDDFYSHMAPCSQKHPTEELSSTEPCDAVYLMCHSCQQYSKDLRDVLEHFAQKKCKWGEFRKPCFWFQCRLCLAKVFKPVDFVRHKAVCHSSTVESGMPSRNPHVESYVIRFPLCTIRGRRPNSVFVTCKKCLTISSSFEQYWKHMTSCTGNNSTDSNNSCDPVHVICTGCRQYGKYLKDIIRHFVLNKCKNPGPHFEFWFQCQICTSTHYQPSDFVHHLVKHTEEEIQNLSLKSLERSSSCEESSVASGVQNTISELNGKEQDITEKQNDGIRSRRSFCDVRHSRDSVDDVTSKKIASPDETSRTDSSLSKICLPVKSKKITRSQSNDSHGDNSGGKSTKGKSGKAAMKYNIDDKYGFKCPKCPFVDYNASYLQEHIAKHDVDQDDEPFICSICPEGANSFEKFREHISHHPDTQSSILFRCIKCQYLTNQSVLALRHPQQAHNSGFLDSCDLIKEETLTVKSLVHACRFCPYSTLSIGDYMHHSRSCTKSQYRKSPRRSEPVFERVSRTLSKQDPNITCPVCSNTFSCYRDLKGHMSDDGKSQTCGNKYTVYKCEETLCSFNSTVLHEMKKHLKVLSHHGYLKLLFVFGEHSDEDSEVDDQSIVFRHHCMNCDFSATKDHQLTEHRPCGEEDIRKAQMDAVVDQLEIQETDRGNSPELSSKSHKNRKESANKEKLFDMPDLASLESYAAELNSSVQDEEKSDQQTLKLADSDKMQLKSSMKDSSRLRKKSAGTGASGDHGANASSEKVGSSSITGIKCTEATSSKPHECVYKNPWLLQMLIQERLIQEVTQSSDDKAYKCGICGYHKANDILCEHILTHLRIHPHQCSLCSFTSTDYNKIKTHIKNKHQGLPVDIFCNEVKIDGIRQASSSFLSTSSYPIGRHSSKDDSSGDKSKKDTAESRSLLPEGNNDSLEIFKCSNVKQAGEKKHICVYSEKKFTEIFRKEGLYEVGNTSKFCICIGCKKQFANAATVVKHLCSSHVNVNPHLCEICKKKAADYYMLEKHFKREHGSCDMMIFNCAISMEYLTNKISDFQRRMGMKGSKESYKCPICEFDSSSKLHIITHTKNRHKCYVHFCSHCKATFLEKDRMKRHEVTCDKKGSKPSAVNKLLTYQDTTSSLTTKMIEFGEGSRENKKAGGQITNKVAIEKNQNVDTAVKRKESGLDKLQKQLRSEKKRSFQHSRSQSPGRANPSETVRNGDKTRLAQTRVQTPLNGRTETIQTRVQTPLNGRTETIQTRVQTPLNGRTETIQTRVQTPLNGRTETIQLQLTHSVIASSDKSQLSKKSDIYGNFPDTDNKFFPSDGSISEEDELVRKSRINSPCGETVGDINMSEEHEETTCVTQPSSVSISVEITSAEALSHVQAAVPGKRRISRYEIPGTDYKERTESHKQPENPSSMMLEEKDEEKVDHRDRKREKSESKAHSELDHSNAEHNRSEKEHEEIKVNSRKETSHHKSKTGGISEYKNPLKDNSNVNQDKKLKQDVQPTVSLKKVDSRTDNVKNYIESNSVKEDDRYAGEKSREKSSNQNSRQTDSEKMDRIRSKSADDLGKDHGNTVQEKLASPEKDKTNSVVGNSSHGQEKTWKLSLSLSRKKQVEHELSGAMSRKEDLNCSEVASVSGSSTGAAEEAERDKLPGEKKLTEADELSSERYTTQHIIKALDTKVDLKSKRSLSNDFSSLTKSESNKICSRSDHHEGKKSSNYGTDQSTKDGFSLHGKLDSSKLVSLSVGEENSAHQKIGNEDNNGNTKHDRSQSRTKVTQSKVISKKIHDSSKSDAKHSNVTESKKRRLSGEVSAGFKRVKSSNDKESSVSKKACDKLSVALNNYDGKTKKCPTTKSDLKLKIIKTCEDNSEIQDSQPKILHKSHCEDLVKQSKKSEEFETSEGMKHVKNKKRVESCDDDFSSQSPDYYDEPTPDSGMDYGNEKAKLLTGRSKSKNEKDVSGKFRRIKPCADTDSGSDEEKTKAAASKQNRDGTENKKDVAVVQADEWKSKLKGIAMAEKSPVRDIKVSGKDNRLATGSRNEKDLPEISVEQKSKEITQKTAEMRHTEGADHTADSHEKSSSKHRLPQGWKCDLCGVKSTSLKKFHEHCQKYHLDCAVKCMLCGQCKSSVKNLYDHHHTKDHSGQTFTVMIIESLSIGLEEYAEPEPDCGVLPVVTGLDPSDSSTDHSIPSQRLKEPLKSESTSVLASSFTDDLNKESDWKCTICSSSYKKLRLLICHCRVEHPNYLAECRLCGVTMPSLKQLCHTHHFESHPGSMFSYNIITEETKSVKDQSAGPSHSKDKEKDEDYEMWKSQVPVVDEQINLCGKKKLIKEKHMESSDEQISPMKQLHEQVSPTKQFRPKKDPRSDAEVSPKKQNDGSSQNITCKLCSGEYHPRYIKYHLYSHFNYKPRKCVYCDYSAMYGTDVRKHQRKVHSDNPVEVDFQPDEKIEAEVLRHIPASHVNDDTYKAADLSLDDDDAVSLDISVNAMDPTKEDSKTNQGKTVTKSPILCQFCGNQYSALQVLKKHLPLHFNYKPYSCGYCEYAYSTEYTVKEHQEKQHKGRPPDIIRNIDEGIEAEINACLSKFKLTEPAVSVKAPEDETGLQKDKVVLDKKKTDAKKKEEKNKTNSSTQKVKCAKCPAELSLCHMKYHLSSHFKYNPNVCGICEKAFVRARDVRRHHNKEHDGITYEHRKVIDRDIEDKIKECIAESQSQGELPQDIESVQDKINVDKSLIPPKESTRAKTEPSFQSIGSKKHKMSPHGSHAGGSSTNKVLSNDEASEMAVSSRMKKMNECEESSQQPVTTAASSKKKSVLQNKSSVFLREQHADKNCVYKCKTCDFRTENIKTIYNHYYHYHAVRDQKCQICEFKSTSSRGLVQHVKAAHPEVRDSSSHVEVQGTESLFSSDNSSKRDDSDGLDMCVSQPASSSFIKKDSTKLKGSDYKLKIKKSKTLLDSDGASLTKKDQKKYPVEKGERQQKSDKGRMTLDSDDVSDGTHSVKNSSKKPGVSTSGSKKVVSHKGRTLLDSDDLSDGISPVKKVRKKSPETVKRGQYQEVDSRRTLLNSDDLSDGMSSADEVACDEDNEDRRETDSTNSDDVSDASLSSELDTSASSSTKKLLFSCHLCKVRSHGMFNFRKHLASSHVGVFKPITYAMNISKCSYCDFTTYNKNDLANHNKKHVTDRPYKCTYCRFNAFHRHEVKYHQTKHHSKDPPNVIDRNPKNQSNFKLELVDFDAFVKLRDVLFFPL